jgi:hypothetical protein
LILYINPPEAGFEIWIDSFEELSETEGNSLAQ